MKAVKLSGLEPACVFAYFEKLCSIPHGSFNTKAISDYFVAFAKEHGLQYIQDKHNNVILFKAASAGYEDHPPIILQGHMDMVCEKDSDSTIDMKTDPLDVTHDGTYVFARGTSLGGDDCAAVAMILALLEDDSIPHPPLEVVLTSDEEPGMLGVTEMDVSMLKGRRMLNLDTLNDTIFTAGCAGAAQVSLEMPVEKAPCTHSCVRIVLDQLHGGHSGSMIKYHYANANKVMGELLARLNRKMPLRLISLSGGGTSNVIPHSCEAVVATDSSLEKIRALCDAFAAELKQFYDEPALTIRAEAVPQADQAYSTASSEKILDLLEKVPNGVLTWNPDFEGLPQTSLNLGIAETRNDVFFLHFHLRSSVNQERDTLRVRMQDIARKYGCSHSEFGLHAAWEYREDSALRKTMIQIYERCFQKSPEVKMLHVGLECCVLSEKLPGLDCVSTGPTALNVHSSRERLDIASMERIWHFLLELLKEL